MARSLTVPYTASLPMSPPGKNSGLTTNESVVKAIRWPLISSTALSCGAWAVPSPQPLEAGQQQPFDQAPHHAAATSVRQLYGIVMAPRCRTAHLEWIGYSSS